MATKKKQWRGRAAYERLVRQRAEEGLTWPELSERSGVPIGTLQRWDRRFRREQANAAEPFVELGVPEADPAADRIEVLLCSGRTIYVPASKPFAGLGELVVLLETC